MEYKFLTYAIDWLVHEKTYIMGRGEANKEYIGALTACIDALTALRRFY